MIVNTNINYTYNQMMKDISILKIVYPFLQIQNTGYSVLGKTIPVIRLGVGPKEVLYSGSIHANEWITSVLLMKFIENYCISYSSGKGLWGYNINKLFNSTSIYIMPMVNPDGVDFVAGAIKPNNPIYTYFQNIANNFPDIPFPEGWKANFNGVDLKNYQPICKAI